MTRRGAVLLGRYVACDGFDEDRPLRVVTHVHSDHMLGLRQSLKRCEVVVMSRATRDLIDVMRGPLFLMLGCVKALDFGEEFVYRGERLWLYPADHILGAAQVLVEDVEGTRILYTGDFRLGGTPVVRADVLVIEATYGSPFCVRSFECDVEDFFVSLVERGLREGVVYVFGYHGKLQEVMQVLRGAGLRVPFVVPERVFHVCKVCERYGMRFGRLLLSFSEEARLLLERGESCVCFYHMCSRGRVGVGGFRVLVSGWGFGGVCRKVGEREFVVALSGHCDFEGLLEYVRRCGAGFVVVDNFRVGFGDVLAGEIRRRLGVEAVALPVKK